MSVVVLSCGRTGTNVCLEILRGNPALIASSEPENKKLVKPVRKYPDNYLTKCDTIYFNNVEMNKLLTENPNMKVIWTVRDPRDIVLSKIYRGQPNTEGRGNWTSADGTPETAVADMRTMITKYENILNNFSDRIMLAKMEDMIGNTEATAKAMCEFLGIDYHENMTSFPNRMRNKHKTARYGNKIHKNQISLWEDVDNVYEGFFAKQNYDIKDTFNGIKDIIEYFNYDV